MAKPEWGTKRLCPSCGARFYDLNKNPAVCPQCGAKVKGDTLARYRRTAKETVKPKPSAEEATKANAKDAEETDFEDDDDFEVMDDDSEDIADEDEDDVIEDASDLGEDDDDMSEVMEHIDNDVEVKG